MIRLAERDLIQEIGPAAHEALNEEERHLSKNVIGRNFKRMGQIYFSGLIVTKMPRTLRA